MRDKIASTQLIDKNLNSKNTLNDSRINPPPIFPIKLPSPKPMAEYKVIPEVLSFTGTILLI